MIYLIYIYFLRSMSALTSNYLLTAFDRLNIMVIKKPQLTNYTLVDIYDNIFVGHNFIQECSYH